MKNRIADFTELLESAYDVTAEPERFEDLLTVAKKYLLAGAQANLARALAGDGAFRPRAK